MKCITFLLIFSFNFISAQVTILNGVVLSPDNRPIPYCSVGIWNTNKGTVCNENGEFILNTDLNETLVISIIGFEQKMLPVKSLTSKENLKIYLTPKQYQLKDVSILAITPLEIIQNAVSNIKNNYPTTPSSLSGFYRETIVDNGEYTRLVEAAIDIYDPGYITKKNKQNETTKLIAVRTSYNLSPVFKGLRYNGLSELFNRNLVKYNGDFLNKENFPNYKYVIDSVTVLNNEPVYVISFSPNENLKMVLSEGSIFIRRKDFAILQINYGVKKNAKYWSDQSFNDTLKWNTNYIEVVLKLEEKNHLLYLNYVSKKYENVYYKNLRSTPSYISTTFSELMINDIKTDKIKPADDFEDMNKKKDIFVQKTSYDSLFWNNYNVIKNTLLQEQVKKDLERQRTLEEQYANPIENIKKNKK